jgi:DNA-directed RNA polymerase subunit RPC12/RpoP
LLVAIGSLFSDLGFITIIALIVGLVGARLLDKLYICPHCGRKLPLRSEGLTEAIKAQCPERCPNCKQAITVELK